MTDSLITRTFDEWSKDGFKIKKGSKAIRINGKYYFTEEQVEQVYPEDYDEEDFWVEEARYYGTD